MGLFTHRLQEIIPEDRALPGRDVAMSLPDPNIALGTKMTPPYPGGLEMAIVAMGCFWGAERKFYSMKGVYTTAVGYAGGFTPNPTYEEVCSGKTGHAEAVLVMFDPKIVSYGALLATFFEGHDPTQYMRQGNDVGTQYRSAIYTFDAAQQATAQAVRDNFQQVLEGAGLGSIATEITPAGPFYFAEDYHQQYLAKHPDGYCGLGGTGLSCPVGVTGS